MMRWNSESLLGRITKRGTLDRRYSPRRWHAEPEPPPSYLRGVVEILLGVIVMLGFVVGVLMWIAIGTVAQ